MLSARVDSGARQRPWAPESTCARRHLRAPAFLAPSPANPIGAARPPIERFAANRRSGLFPKGI